MRHLRFYVPLSLNVGDILQIPEDKARHLTQVLRLSLGAEFILFNGDGHEYTTRLTQLKKRRLTAEILASERIDRESTIQIHLLQGLSLGDRMDATIQKCVELGVDSISPLRTSRSNLKLNEKRLEKKHEHWLKIVQSACEQSGRNTLPQLQKTTQFESTVRHYATNTSALKLILHPPAETKINQLTTSPTKISLLVGSEGGFTDEELQLAQQCGFLPLSLGPRILRTETAGMAAIAGIQIKWGDI